MPPRHDDRAPDPAVCPAHQPLLDRVDAVHTELREQRLLLNRLVIGVCGDLEGEKPGILEKVRSVEFRLKLLIFVLAGIASSIGVIGGIKVVRALVTVLETPPMGG